MRRMHPGSILVFFALVACAGFLAFAATSQLTDRLMLGDFRGVALTASALFFFYLFLILLFRLFLLVRPLAAGEIEVDSPEQFTYHVYLLFFLLLFNPIMYSGLLPIPFMRMFYQGLGARMGSNSFAVGIMLDPHFVTMGDNSIIGNGALLIPHVIEGSRLAHYPITIGSNVTVGARSVVLSDVEIGDGATVAIGAVVKKGSRIPAGEVWGGVPAKRIDSAS